jgi:hypothetical protein
MARMRYIKPSFWSDSKIVGLSFAARLFFIGMWNFADCGEGHLPDDPRALKRLILPDDDVVGDDVIAELVESGLVARLHTLSGRKFLHIIRFADHQKVEKRWSPTCFVCTETRPPSINHDEPLPNTPKHSQSSEEVTQEGRGGEGKKKTSSSAARPTGDDPDFARFWEVYPRKVGKGAARKAWAKVVKSGVDIERVIEGAVRYRDDPMRRKKDLEYTKTPGPWLNDERWTDQLNGNDLRPAVSGWWDN